MNVYNDGRHKVLSAGDGILSVSRQYSETNRIAAETKFLPMVVN